MRKWEEYYLESLSIPKFVLFLAFFLPFVSCTGVLAKKHQLTVLFYDDYSCSFIFDHLPVDVGEANYISVVRRDLSDKSGKGASLRCHADDQSLRNSNLRMNDLHFAVYFVLNEPQVEFASQYFPEINSQNIYKCGFVDVYDVFIDRRLVYYPEHYQSFQPTVSYDSAEIASVGSINLAREPAMSVSCELKEMPRSSTDYWI